MIEKQKRYRASGIALFAVACGLALMRIASYAMSFLLENISWSPYVKDTILEVFFTVPAQIGINLLLVFVVFKLVQKKPSAEILQEASVKKSNGKIYILSFVLGIGCYIFTMGSSSVWAMILMLFGYTYPSGGSVFPESFNLGALLLSILMTAVLPGICEEYATRGGVLTALRQSFPTSTVIVLSGLIFGLFHQYIPQFFYAALLGGILAYLVIKTGSIIPAMIVHFTNNFLAIMTDYADHYTNIMEGFYNGLNALGLMGIMLLLVVGGGIIFAILSAIKNEAKKEHPHIVVEELYKPTAKDSAFHYGALAVTVLATIFTFAFNFY